MSLGFQLNKLQFDAAWTRVILWYAFCILAARTCISAVRVTVIVCFVTTAAHISTALISFCQLDQLACYLAGRAGSQESDTKSWLLVVYFC